MVTPISIGVIGIQGAVSEHIAMMKQVCIDTHVQANIYAIREEEELKALQGIILPGGESTTISRFLLKHGLADAIRKRVTDGSLAIMGTCAGCVLLAKHIVDDKGDVHPLRVLDIDVRRNAFGRQRESFEQNVLIKGWNEPFPAVFIRAPLITRIHGSCQMLSQIGSHIIMVKQENIIAVSFHPELTSDTRIHQYFLSHVRSMM